ncbi:3821_t:CDS:2, partial [Funneliformis geosporum]
FPHVYFVAGTATLHLRTSFKCKTESNNNNSFLPNVLNMNSYQTLEVSLTSRDPAYKLYWNKQVTEWSQKL